MEMGILIVKASKKMKADRDDMLESKVNIIMEQTDRETEWWYPKLGAAGMMVENHLSEIHRG